MTPAAACATMEPCAADSHYIQIPNLAKLFGLDETPYLEPRYNIAPTQPVAIVRLDGDGKREWTHVHWGLVPSWSKDPASARG